MTRTGLAITALALVGCGKWPASMEDQPSIQPLAAPRPAPPGTVPVGGVERLDDREDDIDLVDPLGADPDALERGRRLFGIHCAVCHGPEGHGDGRMSEVFPPAPDLRYLTICRRSDGFIYGTLTAGGRAMPPMREGLTSTERWSLVRYVRDLQRQGCFGRPAAPEPAGDGDGSGGDGDGDGEETP